MSWRQAVVYVFLTYLQYAHGQGLCQDAIRQGNISYRYHPNDCNQYIQCHTHPLFDDTIAVYRACPYGYYWNQITRSCENRTSFSCPFERCINNQQVIRLEGSGCRAHWVCRGGNNTEECCKPGERFVESRGCVADFTCTDPCPGAKCELDEVCRLFPHWDRFDTYYKDEGARIYERLCSSGTVFDILECGCVARQNQCNPSYNVNFDNALELQQARNTWLTYNVEIQGGQALFTFRSSFEANVQLTSIASVAQPLIIKFRFRELFRNPNNQNLLNSVDCKKCNRLSIDMNERLSTFDVTLSKFGNIVARVSLSMQGFTFSDWKEVVVMYNGKELLTILRSGTLSYMKRTQAPKLMLMNCGMQFGSQQNDQFYGFLDLLSIYTCNPGGRSMDFMDFQLG